MNNNETQQIFNRGLSSADSRQIPVQPGVNQPQMQEQAQSCTIRSIVENDIARIQKLLDDGAIDNTQAQYLVNYVINRAYDMVNCQGTGNVQYQTQKSGLEEFQAENSDFFEKDGRAEVLEYLKRSGFDGDKDEISLISQMIEKLEDFAIQRYLKQTAHEKALNDENEIAKQRLRANAQNSNFDDMKTRAFTREQIGKMSGAEFAKFEKAIMEQLRKGLIK